MLKATIIGNLGNDPDMRYAASGSPLLRFNVASNYRARMPEGVAIHGRMPSRAGAAVADRDGADLEDVPF